MKRPKRFRVYRVRFDGTLDQIELPPLDVAFPFVDVFPDGRVLVAGARSTWRDANDYDRNGLVIDPHTGLVKEVLLGDGIHDLAIDSTGGVWVAYGDEGIYGNFGWGPPNGPEPVGAAGLVCFSQDGNKLWEFPSDRTMSDCYALNISEGEVSIYYYTDFPICRILAGRALTFWKTELRGCNEFAISESEALFTGQYEDATDTGYRGTLRNGELRDVRQVRFVTVHGPVDFRGKCIGRGRHLYFSDQLAVYRASLP
jgi:hypothetical protein